MKIILFLFLLAFAGQVSAQTYLPDKYGHISDPKFLQLIKDRNYQLVGSMDSLKVRTGTGGRKKTIMVARVAKEGKEILMDWNGKEYADLNAVEEAFSGEKSEPLRPLGMHGEEAFTVEDNPFPTGHEGEPFLNPKIYKSIHVNGKMGYMIKSDTVVPPVFDLVNEEFDGEKLYLKVIKEGKQGYYSVNGKLLVPVEYQNVELSRSGITALAFYAKLNGKTGTLSSEGKVTVPLNYAFVHWNDHYKILTTSEQRDNIQYMGAYDSTGRMLAPTAYTSIRRLYQTNCLLVDISRKSGVHNYGIIDSKGNLVIDTIYQEVDEYQDGTWKIHRNLQPGNTESPYVEGLFSAKTEQLVLPVEYHLSQMVFDEEWTVISKPISEEESLYGLIDFDGKIRIPLVYERIHYSKYTPLVAAKKDGKFGIIDTLGNVLLPFKYENLMPLAYQRELTKIYPKDLLAFVQDGKTGIMNMKEEVILPNSYDKLIPTPFGLVYENNNYTFGMIDLDQKPLITEHKGEYQEIRNGVIKARIRDRGKVFIDTYGNELTK